MSIQKYSEDISATEEQYRNESRAIDRLDNDFLTGSQGHVSDTFQTAVHAKRNVFFIDEYQTRYLI